MPNKEALRKRQEARKGLKNLPPIETKILFEMSYCMDEEAEDDPQIEDPAQGID